MTSSNSTVSGDSLEYRARHIIDNKTKPPGSLGLLEKLAVQMACVQQTLEPAADPCRIVVFGADHGVCEEGVSAFPSEVTSQMMSNFSAGGAAVCVLGKCAGALLEVVDVGVAGDLSHLENVVHAKVAQGSANLAHEAAMTHEQLDAALQAGREAAVRAAKEGVRCVGLGEMGIGNTTPAAILTGLFCQLGAEQVTGRGTGVDDDALGVKQAIVADCIKRLNDTTDDPMECLRVAGGLDIAAVVGAMLEAPAHRMIVLVDGFIVTAAALIACRLKPSVRDVMVFAHKSAESGHAAALNALQAEPLLDMDLRLGEGSATALALPILRAAAAVMNEMASFDEAGVSVRDEQ